MSCARAARGVCCRATCRWGTIYRWFAVWRDDGRFERINHALVMADRERVGRDAAPRPRSSTAKASRPPRPAARAVTMLERRSTDASAMRSSTRRAWPRARTASCEHPGSRQRRTGSRLAPHLPVRPAVFADSGYAGEKVAKATLIAVEIMRKNPDQIGFAVNPPRWVVERFFAWIGRNRRLAKDFEATLDSAAPSSMPHPSCCSCVGSLVLHDFRNLLLVN